jgi:hypothetical protein
MKTRSALAAIGISHGQFRNGLLAGKFDPPPKDESGDFVWGPEDLERVKAALRPLRQLAHADAAMGCAK